MYFAIFDLKFLVVQEFGYVSQRMCVCVCVCVQSFYFSMISSLFLYLKLISNYLIFLLRNLIFAVLQ